MLGAYQHTIRQLRPGAKDITELGTGDFNEVVLVDDAEVFRFPKGESGKGMLRFEAELLGRLQDKLSLAIPRPIDLADDASYGVFSYVPGNVLSSKSIDEFSEEQKVNLGQSLAHFVLDMNSALSFAEATELRSKYHPNFETESVYHEHMLKRGAEENNPFLPMYVQWHKKLRDCFGGDLPDAGMVAHGDLHTGNLLFTDTRLSGVIDFSDTGPSTIYAELRQMYRLGQVVIQTIVDTLGNAFGPIAMEIVRIYAITHELSILMRPGALNGENSRAIISRRLLERWLSKEWEES